MKSPAVAAFLLGSLLLSSAPAGAQRFKQTNLVSDVSGLALHTDTHLVNPWGLVPGASGTFWVSNNETSTSTLYAPDGTPNALVVEIPGGLPTGVVATSAADSSFRIPSADSTARAIFIFVTQNGTIAAWNPNVNLTLAIQVASNPGDVYTGAALGGTTSQPLLYTANFAGGSVDVYDRDFHEIDLSGNFTDPNLPSGFSPFNVANIGGQILVAYAQRNSATGDEVAGAGLGYVSLFNANGQFVRRLISGAPLNAPWAIVRAPSGFGTFGGSLLVGNFGDGRINAFSLSSGNFQGALQDSLGNPIEIEGLWGLHFGLAVSGSAVSQRLYFAAGIDDETHGLFGYLAAVRAAGEPVCDNLSKNLAFWRKQCGGPSNSHRPDKDSALEQNAAVLRNGNGLGNGFGNAFGHDKHENERGKLGGFSFGKPRPQVSADSLDALFACIRSDGGAFGGEGCLTAGCELLTKVGKRSDQERAGQELLTLRLNLCAGLVCDSLRIGCAEELGGNVQLLSVGEVADSLDALLCDGGSTAVMRSLQKLLACVNHGGEGDDGEDEDNDSDRVHFPKIGIKAFGGYPARLGSDPIRFAISTTEPALVQLRIYDAAGRLVAQPLRNSMVSGSAEARWDGRGMKGELVPPGNYFYRATAGAEASTGRIVLVR